MPTRHKATSLGVVKNVLTLFTDEMTHCTQVMDRETLIVLRRGLDINSLFWRHVQNKDPAINDTLLEIIRPEIINEELRDYQNRAGLPPLQMQRERGLISHLIDQQVD